MPVSAKGREFSPMAHTLSLSRLPRPSLIFAAVLACAAGGAALWGAGRGGTRHRADRQHRRYRHWRDRGGRARRQCRGRARERLARGPAQGLGKAGRAEHFGQPAAGPGRRHGDRRREDRPAPLYRAARRHVRPWPGRIDAGGERARPGIGADAAGPRHAFGRGLHRLRGAQPVAARLGRVPDRVEPDQLRPPVRGRGIRC